MWDIRWLGGARIAVGGWWVVVVMIQVELQDEDASAMREQR